MELTPIYFNSEYRLNFHSSFIVLKHWHLSQIFYVITAWVSACYQVSLHWIFPMDLCHLFFFCASNIFDYSFYEVLTALFLPCHCGTRFTACNPRRGNLLAYFGWPNWPFCRSAFSIHLSWRLLLALRSFLSKCGGAYFKYALMYSPEISTVQRATMNAFSIRAMEVGNSLVLCSIYLVKTLVNNCLVILHVLRLWFRNPPGSWMSVCCKCCVISGRGPCDELITRPEESYRMWCVVLCDLVTS
jgi:hypothetical protein